MLAVLGPANMLVLVGRWKAPSRSPSSARLTDLVPGVVRLLLEQHGRQLLIQAHAQRHGDHGPHLRAKHTRPRTRTRTRTLQRKIQPACSAYRCAFGVAVRSAGPASSTSPKQPDSRGLKLSPTPACAAFPGAAARIDRTAAESPTSSGCCPAQRTGETEHSWSKRVSKADVCSLV